MSALTPVAPRGAASRRLALAAIAVLLALPALAQQVPNPMSKDGANAQLPQALNNLSANTTASTYYAQAYGPCATGDTSDMGQAAGSIALTQTATSSNKVYYRCAARAGG